MMGNRTPAFALVAASAIICSGPPAIAAKFDGSWSMIAVTTRDHCGTIPIGLGLFNKGDVEQMLIRACVAFRVEVSDDVIADRATRRKSHPSASRGKAGSAVRLPASR